MFLEFVNIRSCPVRVSAHWNCAIIHWTIVYLCTSSASLSRVTNLKHVEHWNHYDNNN